METAGGVEGGEESVREARGGGVAGGRGEETGQG